MGTQTISEETSQDVLSDLDNEHLSKDSMWKIDEEFKNAITEHTDEERAGLEESFLNERGFREKLVVWDGYIIDGHLRFEIAQKHGQEKSLQVVDLTDELQTREDVKRWIIKNQQNRRNMRPESFKYYIGKMYNEMKMSHGGVRSRDKSADMKTSEKLAELYRFSPSTIERAGELAEVADRVGVECGEDEKNRIIKGEIKLTYEQVKELSGSENIRENFESFMAEEPKEKAAPMQKEEQGEKKSGRRKRIFKCPCCDNKSPLKKEYISYE
ncbi:MAG TPA: ParB/RepB/Spo0J family partition protein [Victivallales bacterium]|nr:ParB/RepB/Spo0J family partition protein [Victivallales bacterium]